MYRTLLAGLVGLGLAAGAQAGSIVNWGGDYVSSNQAGQRLQGGVVFNFDSVYNLGTNTGAENFINYSTSAELNPAIGANYSGTSAKYYGGVAIARVFSGSPANGSATSVSVLDNGASDRISLSVSSWDGNEKVAGGLVLFLKPDFLNGYDAQTLSLDQTVLIHIDSLLVNLNNIQGFNNVRFGVRTSDGKVYVSNTNLTTGLNTLTSAGIATAMFQEMRLSEGSPQGLGGSFVGSPISSNMLTDVTGVGVVVWQWTGFGAFDGNIQLDAFQVSATVIPEPASLTLLLGGLGLLARRRARTTA